MQSIFENSTEDLSQRTLYNSGSDHSHSSSTHDYSFLPIEGDSHSKSPAIPLPKTHIRRTESENNLTENMRLAEFRDQCMFNRLVNGIQKQQQMLYNAECHDRRRQDSRYMVSRHSIQEEEEEEEVQLTHQAPHQAPHQAHSHSQRRGSRESSFHVPGYNARGSLNVPGYNARSQVAPVSAMMSCLEENKKSIEGIMYTRHQAMTLIEEQTLLSSSSSSSPPQEPEDEEENKITYIVTDDEQSDYDFGPMFEMEI